MQTTDSIKNIKSASELLELVYGDIETITLPIKPEEIINRFSDLTLSEELSFDDWDKAGYIKVNRDTDKKITDICIWVNPLEAEVRKRFTIAHELGHLVHDIYPEIDNTNLNEEFVDILHRKDGHRSFRETRANRFAGQLLMPAPLVREEVKKLIETVKSRGSGKISIENAIRLLSEIFDTSTEAMRIRLENLNIIKKDNRAR